MNLLELQLAYPFGDALPEPGRKMLVAPGIFWLRMPLPFALNHINLWLVRDHFDGQDGWTLIDCGIHSPEVIALWEEVITTQLDDLPILRILCTHNHPDHLGMADTLHRRFGAPLWMSTGEYAMGRLMSLPPTPQDADQVVEHFRRHGIEGQEALDAFRTRHIGHYSKLVPSVPMSYRRIRGDEPVSLGGSDWQVLIGTGHSPEHASLYNPARQVLVSGDMLLPRISTNVSVFHLEPESNPMQWYVDSLQLYRACDPETLVLPSHGRPFRNLHVRVDQLQDHHAERLDQVLQGCRARPLTAAQALPIMFGREFDTHQMTFALGETLAHLHALWYRGELERQIDAKGVVRFGARP